ncbi:hypothetical protein ACFQJD_06325 [Haloplanus sp. GCM10025708]|uniref:hypothetical protein n=1 Tax=Haloplanus sp. GCM10025708 TaxID=3252679 RepID=UPI00361852BA
MSTPTNVRSDVTQEEAAELLSDLVSFDSQNPPGREAAVAKFVAGRLDEWGIDAQLVPRPYEDRPQVVAEVGDGDPEAGTLVLNGHLDVVPRATPNSGPTTRSAGRSKATGFTVAARAT